MSLRNSVRHILEITTLCNPLEVGVFAFHTHAPGCNQGSSPTYQEVNTCIKSTCTIDSLPNDLARKMDHVVHFRSYINCRVTPSEKVVVVMDQCFQDPSLSTRSNSSCTQLQYV